MSLSGSLTVTSMQPLDGCFRLLMVPLQKMQPSSGRMSATTLSHHTGKNILTGPTNLSLSGSLTATSMQPLDGCIWLLVVPLQKMQPSSGRMSATTLSRHYREEYSEPVQKQEERKGEGRKAEEKTFSLLHIQYLLFSSL